MSHVTIYSIPSLTSLQGPSNSRNQPLLMQQGSQQSRRMSARLKKKIRRVKRRRVAVARPAVMVRMASTTNSTSSNSSQIYRFPTADFSMVPRRTDLQEGQIRGVQATGRVSLVVVQFRISVNHLSDEIQKVGHEAGTT